MKFWIPKRRQKIKYIINKCDLCSIRNERTFSYPDPPELSSERLENTAPFSNLAIDYVGPIYIKNKNSSEKLWVVLFTCMVVRAVHFESVTDLSVATFLNCFRRIISRRGLPKFIYSYNTTYFKSASKSISKVFQNKIQTNHSIEWKFNTEFAPWKGGVYERLVRNLKNSIKCCLLNKIVSFDNFITILCKIKNVINNRPLTYIAEDEREIILKPCSFLSHNQLFSSLFF